jgi:hypothetical protein
MAKELHLPDQETLIRFLAVLENVIIDARFRAYSVDPQLVALLDAVHNLPNLLTRSTEAKPEYIAGDLEHFEKTFLNGVPRYTGILRDGVGATWQWPRGNGA